MRRDDFSLPEPPPIDRPGEMWMCGAGAEIPCAAGPDRQGRCGGNGACRPVRRWRGRRRRWTVALLALVAIGIALVTQSEQAAWVFRPGDLATPHAQILSGTVTAEKCGACHEAASLSPLSWFRGGGSAHAEVSQTDRCLDCHHTTIERRWARSAHNLSPEQRTDIRLALTSTSAASWRDRLPRPRTGPDDMACAACHREHRGADGDLREMSDLQCQTCHTNRFGSFAADHPWWNDWPYDRGGDIAFDHASHAGEHYPATLVDGQPTRFDCQKCHRPLENGELARAPSFEQGCATCHDASLRVAMSRGLALIALPTISPELAAGLAEASDEPLSAAATQQTWPEAGVGFSDGILPPLMTLLLRGDASVASALDQIPASDFSRIEAGDPRHRNAAIKIARGTLELLDQVRRSGQQAITRRLETAGLPAGLAAAVATRFPPQVIEGAAERWWRSTATADPARATAVTQSARQSDATSGERGEDLLLAGDDPPIGNTPKNGDDLLAGGDLLAGDDLLLNDAPPAGAGVPLDDESLLGPDPLVAADPLLTEATLTDSLSAQVDRPVAGRFIPAERMPLGGWYRDDLRLSIEYRPAAHADPLLQAAFELAGNLPPDDPVRGRLLEHPALQSCWSCHRSVVQRRSGWKASPQIGARRRFTKFLHGPHRNHASLADCVHCHRVDFDQHPEPSSVSMVRWPGTETGAADDASPHGEVRHGFAPLGKATCAACHTPRGAGDACTKCHHYHVQLP